MLCRHPAMRARAARGFTLVELLTVLAIAALLSSLAYPSFARQLQHAQRAEAVVALHQVLLAEEQWRAAEGRYASRFKLAGATLKGVSDDPSDSARWTLANGLYHLEVALDSREADRYTVRAVAAAGSAQAGDSACATMALTVSPGSMNYEPKQCFSR